MLACACDISRVETPHPLPLPVNGEGSGKRVAQRQTLSVVTLISFAAAPALAQQPAPFFANKSIELIISSGVGGGYDAYSRLIAQHMERHVPGNPRIVPKNMTGAGGIVAMNYLANVAARDGTSIGQVQNTVPFDPLFSKPGVQFDPQKLEYLGSANGETPLVFTWHASPTKTFADLQQRETPMAVAAGSISQFHALAMNDLAGARIKIVAGYPGGNDGLLAMERGEVEGHPTIFWSTLKTQKPDWVGQNKMNLLVQFAVKKHAELPQVPLILDFVPAGEPRQTIELMAMSHLPGRPFVAPPGVPKERVEILRTALMETLRDGAFLADAQRRQMEIEPMSGADVAGVVESAFRMPRSVVERAKKYMTP